MPDRSFAWVVRLGAPILLVACHGTDITGGGAVTGLRMVPDSVTVVAGSSVQLAVADDRGGPVSGVVWSSSDTGRATVSPSGLVLPVRPGRAVIAASIGRTVATAVVRSAVAKDFVITDAQFTQGVQAADGSIPMVLSGDAAVVNVLMRTDRAGDESMPVVLRLFDGSGALLRSDTARTGGGLAVAPSYAAPTIQFLVPATTLPSVASWQVVRDPGGELPDSNPSDDAFPRTGRSTLAKVTVPPLAIRFVPIVLTASGNATGQVTPALLPEYLRTVRSLHPVGRIDATIGAPLSSAAVYGSPPSGGNSAFWQQVLAEVDLARVADVSGDPNSYWMGILVPPAGFTYTDYGGFAYIPSSGAATGAGTRSAVAVQIGWFSRPTQARDDIAHELGHNFGRNHAPCGGAASPDPAFPNRAGQIGTIGHDVFSWANGDATSAMAVSAQTGDLMGYCTPVWISEYTYRNVLQFRGATTAALRAAAKPVTCLIVRGRIEGGTRVVLEPVFAMTARPTAPERGGRFQLALRATDGRALNSYSFDPAVIDHAAAVRHFLFAIPITTVLDDSLASVEVTGAGAGARLRSSSGARLRASGGPAPTVVRAGTGVATFACSDPGARGILVLDRATGALLGTASSAAVGVASAAGQGVTVVCSDGLRSVQSELAVP